MARCDCGENEVCRICLTPPHKDTREIECGGCYERVFILPDDDLCPNCGEPLTSYGEEQARKEGVD